MALQWIDVARSNLWKASNSYADIQRQLDRYNKVFETYANASPETQMRAASVMRQALDVYNGLKKQQEENTIKIYEAQQWVDYYNNKPQKEQPAQSRTVETAPVTQQVEQVNVATDQVPVISTSTPWVLNNNAPTTNMEVNAIDTNKTANVSNPVVTSTNKINPTAPIWSTPKYPNTTIGPVTNNQTTTIKWPNYWPGSIATMPGTWNVLTMPTTYRSNNNSLSNSLKNYVRKGARLLYNYLTR